MKIQINNLFNFDSESFINVTIVANQYKRTFKFRDYEWSLGEAFETGRGEREFFHSTSIDIHSDKMFDKLTTIHFDKLDVSFEEQVIKAVKWIAEHTEI